MGTYIISEAKPKLGSLVRQAAAGKTVYLLNGKDMVALVPARPTHDAADGMDAASSQQASGRIRTHANADMGSG